MPLLPNVSPILGHLADCPKLAAPPLWQRWLQATRPQTLLLAVAPLLAASALAAQVSAFAWPWLLLMVWATIGLQIASNLFNDWADGITGADGADRLGPVRAVQAGWLSPQAVHRAGWLAVLSSTLAGAVLLWRGGWPILLIGLLSIATAYGYTAKPMQLAYRGLGDVAVFCFFGPIAVHGGLYIFSNRWSAQAWLPSIALGCLATAVLVVNHLRDKDSDTRHHKRTLVVRFGLTAGRLQYSLLHAIALCAGLSALWSHGNGSGLGLLTPASSWLCLQVWRRQGQALAPLLGLTALYTLLFAGVWSLASWP